jgi:cell wall-associated NlpC family hydrolase
MHRVSNRLLVATVLALAMLAGSRARAQSRFELSPFASRNSSLAGSPTLVGAALTSYGGSLGGIFGMRFGGGYDIRALTSSSTATDFERGWVADADAVISPSRLPVIGPLLGGFIPTFFSGIGAEGLRRSDGTGGQSLVGSYGVGVARHLGSIAFETEARHRVPINWSSSSNDGALPPLAQKGWEYRIGFSVGFGGKTTPRGLPSLPIPAGSRSSTRNEPAPTASASAVLTTGDSYLGTRYTYGGSAPQTGFDCSGFVQFVYGRNGITLPRTSRQQATAGRSMPTKLDGNLRAGDLLFFSQSGDVVNHVAIYVGNDRILHSSSSGGGVRYDDLSTARGKWFRDRLVAVRRVLGDGASFVDPGVVAQLDQKLDPPDSAPKP